MSNDFKKLESALTMRPKASFALSEVEDKVTIETVLTKSEEESPLVRALKLASGVSAKGAPQLAFTENPHPSDNYLGLYKSKRRLLPDEVIKQIRVTDHLVASILRVRSGMMALFGDLKPDRFSAGIQIEIRPEIYEVLSSDQHMKVLERIKRAEKLLLNCGHTEGLENHEKMTLANFLSVSTSNALSFARNATEIIYDLSGEPDENGNYPFHRFRPIDVATIYRAVRKGEEVGNNLRQLALNALQSLKGEKINIDVNKLKEDQYAWLQIIEGTPRQAFTHDEMIVHNFFESTDIEHNGYPVSPLDTIISSVTTHISIDAYKKLYFQNGRATKGMLVIQSDEVDEPTLNSIKTQFNASINSVSNSFRTPIFGVGADDKVQWVSMVGEGLTDEFEYMYDQIARVIMSAFSMSPDELPGYGHLAKGTNSQTLSECLDYSSAITTENGLVTVGDLLKDHQSVNSMIWTGKQFSEGKIFKTGLKRLMETQLSGGMSIKTSPDHKFKTVNENGELEWKLQSELKTGDYVLTSAKTVNSVKNSLKYNNIPVSDKLMEILGWSIGDGSLASPGQRKGGYLKLFYHSEKEVNIWENHYNSLVSMGFSPIKKKIERTEKKIEDIKNRYGFKNVSKTRLEIVLYNSDFVRWLTDNGFKTSVEGKEIPQIMHVLPESDKCAFLRGFFSADGHINKNTNSAVYLTVSNDILREQTKKLLLNLGIRSNNFSGTTKQIFVGNKRETVAACNKISVKDKRKFFSKIGFLQTHKQPKPKDLVKYDRISLPLSLQKILCTALINSDIERKYKKEIYVFASGKKTCTLQRIKEWCLIANMSVPCWVEEYNTETVLKTIDLGKLVEMADVTMFNDEHEFIANGILVHNSNNEYKMTAARDAGLRPLILQFQTLFNQRLFPLIDPFLAKICVIKFSGLDAQSKEQESARLQQDSALHMNYDDILNEVDKKPIGASIGGKMPMNERLQIILDKYSNVGEIRSAFFNDPSGTVDPMLKYKRDPFALQELQLLSQISPNTVRAFFAPKPFALDFLKMNIEDYLEGIENVK